MVNGHGGAKVDNHKENPNVFAAATRVMQLTVAGGASACHLILSTSCGIGGGGDSPLFEGLNGCA